MTDSLPTVRAASPHAALARDALAAIPADALARWLAARRWFGAKGGAPARVEITRVVPLPWEDGRYGVAELVTEGPSGSARWQLPLAATGQQPTADGRGTTEPIARIALDDGSDAWLVDATADDRFLRHLADAFGQSTGDPQRHGSSVTANGVTWSAETLGHEAFVVPLDTHVRVASGEQSNTSILIGDRAILKLFRRLESGEHPDVEVTRFLTTEAAFPHTPTLLGVISVTPSGEPTTVMGMLQEFLPESMDAWKWTVKAGAGDWGLGAGNNTESTQHPAPGTYSPHAERLGVVTRAMHEAFAGEAARAHPDFAPEPATDADVERWGERVKRQVDEALAVLGRQVAAGGLAPAVREVGETLAARAEAWRARVDAIAAAVARDAGWLVRHHGDYHLGQVLRTASGDFMVIDFEGEPTRPLADRRRKQSALRDVAGMLRSFAYAAATLASEAPALDDAERRAAAARWEREARDAFMHGYLRRPVAEIEREPSANYDRSGFLPREAEDVTRLITMFEIEKVFYELAYELNNRPDWVRIPLEGIARMEAP